MTSPPPGRPGFVRPDPADRPRRARRAVRVLILDEEDRVLLFLDSDLGLDPVPHWWGTPGGGVDPGESDLEAAIREVREETGLVIDSADLIGPVCTRRVRHGYSDQVVDQSEEFYLLRVPGFEVDTSGHTEEERLCYVDVRWWARTAIVDEDGEGAAVGGYAVWPRDLLEILALAERPEAWRDAPVDRGIAEESTVPG